MKDELRYIGKKIVENHFRLAQTIDNMIDESYTQSLNNSGMPASELTEYRAELIQYFGEALYEDGEFTSQKVLDWGKKAAEFAIQYNVSLSKSIRAVSFYRTVIWDVFTEELEQKQFAAKTMLDVSKIVDPLLDDVNGVIGEVYENHNTTLMNLASIAIEELSVPVVPIAVDIAVIPIIGLIDTRRAHLIMETSLNEGARLNVKKMILDVSGVPIIDTMVADQIFKIVKALKLTGIEAIISGIRPEIAQTIVSLGLNFGEISTRANMQQALSELGFRQIQNHR
jgi:rsbT co-antagonist protein RsbR